MSYSYNTSSGGGQECRAFLNIFKGYQKEDDEEYYQEEDDDYPDLPDLLDIDEEEQRFNRFIELYRNEPIVGKFYFVACIDTKDIDYSQQNNLRYYAPHNKIIYMGEFERLKSTGGGHTSFTTYYFADGREISEEYMPLLCFLEA